MTKQVEVQDSDNNFGMGEVIAKPNLVDESKSGGAVIFTDAAGPSLTLNVSVYTMAGELVTRVTGTPGSGVTAWNPKGLASGLYLAAAELRDANGGYVGRQIKKILIRR